jgi:hypothetical protein
MMPIAVATNLRLSLLYLMFDVDILFPKLNNDRTDCVLKKYKMNVNLGKANSNKN